MYTGTPTAVLPRGHFGVTVRITLEGPKSISMLTLCLPEFYFSDEQKFNRS